jgi:putative iron-dependent peroxidase
MTVGPQPFLQGNGLAISHLQFNFRSGVADKDLIARLGLLWECPVTGDENPTIEGVYGHTDPPTYGAPSGNIVVGFRPEWWSRVDPNGVPGNLKSFNEDLRGIDGSVAPATQRDLWIWLNQSSADRLYDSTRKIRKVLEGVADLAEARECFTYHNSVTLDGFTDGIGNPNTFRAPSVSVIPSAQPGGGGTTVFVQKWLMEVEKMRALNLSQGEAVYGRSKLKGHKLSPLPERSHVARNQFYDADGNTIDIVRRNAYFGDTHEAGVMFVGFSNNIDVTLGMLKQMYGVGPDGIKKTDALLDFSRAVSGAVYFVPSYDALMRAGVQVSDQP